MEPKFLRAFVAQPDQVRQGKPGEPIRFIAATEGVKRDGLDLVMDGVQLDNYLANPVFLWSHDYWGTRLPIGRAVNVQVFDGDLIADVEFDQADEFARQVEGKYRGGYLNTVSIGWDTKQSEGMRVLEWELLDISGVNVPGDPQALMERQQAALRGLHQAIGETLSKIEDPDEGEPEPEAEAEPEAKAVSLTVDDFAQRVAEILTPMLERLAPVGAELDTTEIEAEAEVDVADLEDFVDTRVLNVIAWLVSPERAAELGLDVRAGSVLSKRNRERLEVAREAIEAVLEAATPVDDENEGGDRAKPDTEDDAPAANPDGGDNERSARSSGQPDNSYLLELESLFSA